MVVFRAVLFVVSGLCMYNICVVVDVLFVVSCFCLCIYNMLGGVI